jgi:CBS domain-containing protein
MAQAVRDLMSTQIVTCAPNASIKDVAKKMRDEDIGDVLVTEGDQLRGIVTDRDLVVRCLADGTNLSKVKVADIISTDLVSISPDTSAEEAARLMGQRSVRRLPVVDGGRAVGIVSIGDLAMERDPNSVLAGISSAPPNS